MADKKDGIIGPGGDQGLLSLIKKNINEIEEKGSFSEKEQLQFSSLLKAVNNQGGIEKLDSSSLLELNHIVKVLGSSGDKSTMTKDEVGDFISNIAKHRNHR